MPLSKGFHIVYADVKRDVISMTDEEKKAAELAQAEADAKAEAEQKANNDAESDKTEEVKKENSQFDYEAELKAERERAEKATQAAADLAFKLRDKKRKEKEEAVVDEEPEDDDDDDKPLTARQLQSILAKNTQDTEKRLQAAAINEKAGKLAQSDSERNLIIEVHKNRTFPAGMSLDEQIEESWVIANRKRILAQNEELKRSLKSRETASDNAASTHRDPGPSSEPKMSANDANAIKASGFIWDGARRLWKKPLRDGKSFLYKDPKTGKLFRQ